MTTLETTSANDLRFVNNGVILDAAVKSLQQVAFIFAARVREIVDKIAHVHSLATVRTVQVRIKQQQRTC